MKPLYLSRTAIPENCYSLLLKIVMPTVNKTVANLRFRGLKWKRIIELQMKWMFHIIENMLYTFGVKTCSPSLMVTSLNVLQTLSGSCIVKWILKCWSYNAITVNLIWNMAMLRGLENFVSTIWSLELLSLPNTNISENDVTFDKSQWHVRNFHYW